MRALAAFVSLTLACSAIASHPIAAPGADGLPAAPAPVPVQVPPSPEAPAPPPPETPAPPLSSPERIATDTPKTTVLGNTFVAPAGWSFLVRGAATVLEAPEGDSRIALVDIHAEDADGAVALAWTHFGEEKKWPLLPIAARKPSGPQAQ